MMQNNNASIRITTSDTEDESEDRTWESKNAVLNALALSAGPLLLPKVKRKLCPSDLN